MDGINKQPVINGCTPKDDYAIAKGEGVILAVRLYLF